MMPFSCAVLTALLLMEAGWRQQMNNWGNQRILLFLGRISYSLYLTHVLVTTVFYDLFSSQATSPELHYVIWLAGIGMAFAVAVVAHYFVEKPTIALARRLKSSEI